MIVATCVTLSGCLSGFKHPLGPVDDAFIEPGLVGRWECVGTEDSSSGVITILDFDGKQYYLFSSGWGNDEPVHTRAYASRVDGVPFLSVRAIGPKPEDEWTFLGYDLVDADHFRFRLVDPQEFEDVIDDAASVRDRLASRLQDPEVVQDFMSCTRNETGK